MEPLISVIIPVYGVEKFLQDCIDSLLSQTMNGIEYIFVNDASPDNCPAILHKNQLAHPDMIRVIDLKENKSQGGARNEGIKAARGVYIGFCDGDDMVAPWMYERMYKKAEQMQTDVVYVQYTAVPENCTCKDIKNGVTDERQKPFVVWSWDLLEQEKRTKTDPEIFLTSQTGGVGTGLWRKSFLKRASVAFPEKLKYEDNFWSSVICTYINKIAFIRENGYYYRMNSSSTLHSGRFIYDRIPIERALIQEAKNRNLFQQYYSAWEYIFITRYASTTAYLLWSGKGPADTKTIRMIYKELWHEFPFWWKNKYYIKKQGGKQRLKDILIAVFPVPCSYGYRYYSRIKNRVIKRGSHFLYGGGVNGYRYYGRKGR